MQLLNSRLENLAHLRIMNIFVFILALLLVVPAVHGQSTGSVLSPAPVSAKPAASLASPAKAASAPSVPAVPPQPLTPSPYLSSLAHTNGFDSERKLWPDKAPPPPPAPLPPPPPPVTDQDLQLYGVVIVGQTKRATVKVGSRFSALAATGRSFVTLSEGQALGEYVLAEIRPTHVVLSAPGVKQTVNFNKKTDRMASPSPQPVQARAPMGNEPVPTGTVSAPAAGATPDNSPAATAATRAPGEPVLDNAAVSATPKSGLAVAESTIRNAQPGSLAAAIGAAQAAAQNAPQPAQNAPPASFNPFLSLFPKQ